LNAARVNGERGIFTGSVTVGADLRPANNTEPGTLRWNSGKLQNSDGINWTNTKPVHTAPSGQSGYIIYSSGEEVSKGGFNVTTGWRTLKQFTVDKDGPVRVEFEAYIRSGQRYWAMQLVNQNSIVVGQVTYASIQQTLEGSSVHNYHVYSVLTSSLNEGDVISANFTATTSGSNYTPVSSTSSQPVFCRNFVVRASTPSKIQESTSSIERQNHYCAHKTSFNEAGVKAFNNRLISKGGATISYDEDLKAVRLYKATGAVIGLRYDFDNVIDTDVHPFFSFTGHDVPIGASSGKFYFSWVNEDGSQNDPTWEISGASPDDFSTHTVRFPVSKKIKGFYFNTASSNDGADLYMRDFKVYRIANDHLDVIEDTGLSSVLAIKNGVATMPNQPGFMAQFPYGGGSSSVSNSVYPFSQTHYNIGSHYNTSTYRFTAPVAGRYMFGYQLLTNAGGGRSLSYLRINASSSFSNSQVYEGSADSEEYNDAQVNTILNLNANDYVDVYIGGSGNLYTAASGQNKFYGNLIC